MADTNNTAHAWIYIIQGDRHVKVGYSAHPERRLTDLNCASPAKLSLAFKASIVASLAPRAERLAHDALSEFRRNGEWFRCSVPRARRIVLSAIRKAEPAPATVARRRKVRDVALTDIVQENRREAWKSADSRLLAAVQAYHKATQADDTLANARLAGYAIDLREAQLEEKIARSALDARITVLDIKLALDRRRTGRLPS